MSGTFKKLFCVAAIVCFVFIVVLAPAWADDTTTKYDNSVPPDTSDTTNWGNGRIPIGSSGKGDDKHARQASVIKDVSTYKMWYSGCKSSDSKWRIYYATSTDGLTWSKSNNVAEADSDTTGTDGRIPRGSTTGRGDTNGVLGPCVIKDGATYKMWYGGADGVNWRIYYATSTDGLTWIKSNNVAEANSDTTGTDGRIPLGATGGDTKYTIYPTVIKDDSTYKMWYSGHDGTNYRIYYATSTDGLTWSKSNNVAEANSDTTGTDGRIPLGSTGGRGDTTHAFGPAVIKDGATYRMWYCGYVSPSYRIYHATSTDGLTWTKVDNTIPDPTDTTTNNGRIALGTADTGDDQYVIGICAIRDGSKYKLWYTGYDGANYRIYYAFQEAPGPIISNNPAIYITATNASLIGNLTSTGGAPTEVYCYWGQTNGYTTKEDWATKDYLGTNDVGLLTNSVSGLATGTLYYYRFYATNSVGDDWADSSELFSTLGPPAVNNDGGATNVTATTATLRGEVIGGNPTPTAYIYWGPSDQGTNKTAWSNEVNTGTQLGAFSTSISGLLANQTNYYRCFATNSDGGAWAPDTTNFVGVPLLSINDTEVTEGDSGTANAVFLVTLSATSVVDVTVNFAASNGTAEAGTDFYETNGTLTIEAGVVSNTITVKVKGDTVDEYPSENFYVNLSDPTNATISDSTGVGTIIDDDDTWQVKIWTGTGNWTSSTNWTPEGMPSASDDAIIGSGTVTLSNSATIASLIVSNNATLSFTGTNNALIAATNVVVNGTITHNVNTDTDEPWSPDNRVYLICSNLTVASGAAIDVDEKGYAAQAGPGAGGYDGGSGYAGAGGYGGVGGGGNPASSNPGGDEYGSATNPVDPGSGGGRSSGGRGGGWVFIEATGRVTVDGEITAKGGDGSAGVGGGAGSGGGIYITCNTFAGMGEVRVNGGGNSTYGQAGGGRIALHYNIAAQAVLNQTASPTVKLIAKRGSTGSNKGRPGTVYLSDAGFWPTNTLYEGQLIIPGFVLWRPDSVTANEGLAVFTNGFQLIVTNDVSIGSSGGIEITNGVLSAGGILSVIGEATVRGEISVGSNLNVNGGTMRFYSASTNSVTLNIGGSLWMNSGKLYVYGGATNSDVPYGAQVNVAGDATVTNSSWIYPYSQSTNGGSPIFWMRNLLIGSNAGFNASTRGYGALWPRGYGPGAGTCPDNGYAGGGGYGGKGGDGWSQGVGGGTYGSSNAPVDPGSGGGRTGNNGGGLIRVEVRRRLELNGSMVANGSSYALTGGSGNGGGAGGGIYLRCPTFAGTNAILSAIGGNATETSGRGGGGGGGRIAVWRTYHRVDTNTLTVSVDGGTAGTSGEDGTIFWGHIPPKGTFIHIR